MKRALTALLFAAFVVVSAPAPTHALALPASATQFAACDAGIANFLGLRSWDACLPKADLDGDGKPEPQFKDLSDVWLIGIVIVEDFIKVIGYMSVGFVIWGGIKYLKSQGEPAETTAARQIINNALFGLVLSVIAVAVVQFISGAITAS